MGPRKACLLTNEAMVAAASRLKEELFKDFRENSLEKCETCSCGFSEEVSQRMHIKLMSIYADLVEIEKIVKENIDKKESS
ncbi:MAG: hypothetical protein P9M12_01320 [Candidatus Aceula lacicola]|nr:hypothetical protein [Candidatus Aceula lacicola]